MNKISATDLFNDWALNDKDFGMEKHHLNAVNIMLDILFNSQQSPFSFIDVGCGNGWVVRKVKKNPLCLAATGIDGANEMIRKAKRIDPYGDYIHSEVMKWSPMKKVDFVHSMEVFYYFTKPRKLVSHITKNWLKRNGEMIMGIDYYKENSKSHSWPKDLNTAMNLMDINEWKELFEDCGMKDISHFHVNSNPNFIGTLVVKGVKG